MVTIGAIWRRFILALDCWPWRLGLLVGDFLTPPQKIALLQELKKARSCKVVSKHKIKPQCRCLDDVTLALIEELGDDEGKFLDSEQFQHIVDVFHNIPLTNV